jgi:hypothetical protein
LKGKDEEWKTKGRPAVLPKALNLRFIHPKQGDRHEVAATEALLVIPNRKVGSIQAKDRVYDEQ